jgi:hypothetical protein
LDRLVAEGQVSPSLYDEVLIHAQRTQSTAEEAILQLGLMSEGELLKYIAGLYRTRFVGSERLAKAGVDPLLLKQVPRKLAKKLTAFPIMYDTRDRTLSVVAADVTDDDVRQQMQFATGARDVKVYVAREAAIRAAIAKHYDQDDRPFEMLLSGVSSRQVRSSRESDPVPGWGQVFEDRMACWFAADEHSRSKQSRRRTISCLIPSRSLRRGKRSLELPQATPSSSSCRRLHRGRISRLIRQSISKPSTF